MVSSKGLVLVTGANGYIAASVIEAFLQAGYSVRGTVRARHKADALVKALSHYAGNLEIVDVPDIGVEGAFDSAVKGCCAVAHLAAPVGGAFERYEGDPAPLMRAYVEGTLRPIESAMKEPGIKAFVNVGSLAGHLNQWEVTGPIGPDDWNTTSEQQLKEMGNSVPAHFVYAAGKTAGERVIWTFREERKPSFGVTSVNPCIVCGPPVVPPAAPDQIPHTTRVIWEVFNGTSLDKVALETHQGFVDVRDVARLCVFGVEHPEKMDGERVLAAGAYGPPQSVADILLKEYPDRAVVIDKGTPGQGYLPGHKSPTKGHYDGSKAVRITGQEYLPWERTVLDTVKVFNASPGLAAHISQAASAKMKMGTTGTGVSAVGGSGA